MESEDLIQDHTGQPYIEPMLQSNFLDRVRNPQLFVYGMPTRTLQQVVGEDFTGTIGFIRKTYVPHYNPIDHFLFTLALEWESENTDKFRKIMFDKDMVGKTLEDSLEPAVLLNYHTLFWKNVLGDGIKKNYDVAFEPVTPNWENDIRMSTLEQFEKIKLFGFPGNDNQNTNSTTGQVWMFNKFFASSGEILRNDAIDILTYHLFMHYWISLKRRVDYLSYINPKA